MCVFVNASLFLILFSNGEFVMITLFRKCTCQLSKHASPQKILFTLHPFFTEEYWCEYRTWPEIFILSWFQDNSSKLVGFSRLVCTGSSKLVNKFSFLLLVPCLGVCSCTCELICDCSCCWSLQRYCNFYSCCSLQLLSSSKSLKKWYSTGTRLCA